MATNFYFGWEALFNAVKSDIRHEPDLLMALAHWLLTKESFKCIGVGEDRILMGDEVGSELLPRFWNDNDESYSIKYIRDDKLYLLIGTIHFDEEKITIHLLDANNLNVGGISINYKEEVKSLNDSLHAMIPRVNNIIYDMKTNLFELIITKKKITAETQTASAVESRSFHLPRYSYPYDYQPLFRRRPDPFFDDDDPIRNVGRSDLDPLGRGGTGMLFPSSYSGINPRYPNLRHPPPPGARYDPIYPDTSDIRVPPEPNPDHMRPPPDYDDMYS